MMGFRVIGCGSPCLVGLRFKVRSQIYVDRLELWLCYMIGFGVLGYGSPRPVGLELEVILRLTG